MVTRIFYSTKKKKKGKKKTTKKHKWDIWFENLEFMPKKKKKVLKNVAACGKSWEELLPLVDLCQRFIEVDNEQHHSTWQLEKELLFITPCIYHNVPEFLLFIYNLDLYYYMHFKYHSFWGFLILKSSYYISWKTSYPCLNFVFISFQNVHSTIWMIDL